MVLDSLKTLMDDGFALEELRTEFFFRMVVLTLATIQGIEQRTLRMNAICGKLPLPPHPLQPGKLGVAQLADVQAKYLSSCGDVYVKEVRNLTQAAFLTQDELMDWRSRMMEGWVKIAFPFRRSAESKDVKTEADQKPLSRRREAIRMRNALSFMKPSASF